MSLYEETERYEGKEIRSPALRIAPAFQFISGMLLHDIQALGMEPSFFYNEVNRKEMYTNKSMGRQTIQRQSPDSHLFSDRDLFLLFLPVMAEQGLEYLIGMIDSLMAA